MIEDLFDENPSAWARDSMSQCGASFGPWISPDGDEVNGYFKYVCMRHWTHVRNPRSPHACPQAIEDGWVRYTQANRRRPTPTAR